MRKLPDQTEQSSQFVREHQEEVDQLLTACVEAGRQFVGLHGTMLQAGTNAVLTRSLDSKNPVAFMVKLREFASVFAGTAVSLSYWGLVDAIGALADAVGTQWLFMSEETRLTRLQHSKEHLGESQLLVIAS